MKITTVSPRIGRDLLLLPFRFSFSRSRDHSVKRYRDKVSFERAMLEFNDRVRSVPSDASNEDVGNKRARDSVRIR